MVSPRRRAADESRALKQSHASRRSRPRRDEPAELAPPRGATAGLADAERKVLGAFRTYLMAPGEMLCFTSSDVAAMKEGLRRLTDAGMLVAESFPGAYSLTSAGFALMGASE